jgi:hypothetical protein
MGTEDQISLNFDFGQNFHSAQNMDGLIVPITEQKISLVIAEWPHGKAPCPDGLLGEFYQTLRDMILPDLFAVFKKVMEHPN